MNSTTTTAAIEVLRTTFACYGLPESIVSDNGPQFCSSELLSFVTQMVYVMLGFCLIIPLQTVWPNVPFKCLIN